MKYKNLVTISSGTILAQAINITSLIILARYLGPKEFNAYGLFSAVTALLLPISTMRYEYALYREESINRRQLISYSSTVMITVVLFLIYILDQIVINPLINLHSIGLSGKEIVIGAWVTAVLATVTQYANTEEKYKLLGFSLVTQSLVGCVISLILFKMDIDVNPLIYGQMTGQIVALLILTKHTGILFEKNRKHICKQSLFKLYLLVIKHRKYATYEVLPTLLNNIQLWAPLYALNIFYGQSAGAVYTMINRLIAMPLRVVTSGIAFIFNKRISLNSKFNDELNKKQLKKIFFRISIVLAVLSIFFWFVGEAMISLLLGSSWVTIAPFMPVFIFAIGIQTMVSIMSMKLTLTGKLKESALAKITLLVSTILWLLLGTYFENSDDYIFLIAIMIATNYYWYFGRILK